MWNWLRNPKNLAVITAVASAVGFAWTKLTPTKDIAAPPPIPAQPLININIDTKQTNTQTVSPSTVAVSPPTPLAATKENERISPAQAQQHLPLKRQLAAGVPLEILTGFWLTLQGYEGTPGNLTAYFVSPTWGSQQLSFKIGGAPFDFTHNGNTYQLVVESMKDERVFISIHH